MAGEDVRAHPVSQTPLVPTLAVAASFMFANPALAQPSGVGAADRESDVGGRPVRTHPLVIAHRGFSWIAPENTLAAYRLAMEAGAEMAECDVWLSADGVPVLLHDRDLERTTGVAGPVTERTVAELKQLDAGSWKSEEYAGERIPTLVETLRLVKGRMRLVIEIKPSGMEQEVVDAIAEAGVAPEDVMIFSFRHDVVDRIARIEPLLPTTWLVGDFPEDEEGWPEVIRQALRARVSALGLSRRNVPAGFVHLAHQVGLPVFVWTVNEEEEMRRLIDLGVDAIITDRPDVLLSLLEGEHAAAP